MLDIGFAVTGSFCTHSKILEVIESLSKQNHLFPIVSTSVRDTDTRFGSAAEFLTRLESLTQNKIISTIVDAEPLGPNNVISVLVIAPCTGNTLAKLANGISDNAVTMVAKAHMRNNKPIVIGISTNDALGFNLTNIAKLLQAKNIFFVPFGQDSPEKKPKSLICDYDLIEDTIEYAMRGEQIQPLLIK